MATLLLLRHGQIAANRDGRWHGSTDSRLTWRGRRQARRTARHVARHYPQLAAVYASPLTRTLDTARRVAKALQLPVETLPGLAEYAIGDWEDLPFRVLAEQHDFVRRATADPDFAPPGGESLAAVAQRITGALAEVDAAHDDDATVLVVSHGAVLAVALATLVDGDPAKWTNYPFDNCSLSELVLTPGAYLNYFNRSAHL